MYAHLWICKSHGSTYVYKVLNTKLVSGNAHPFTVTASYTIE